jgi:hypothetical protein
MGWKDWFQPPPPQPKPGPRSITEDDVDGWFEAARQREEKPPYKKDRDTLRAYLEHRNRARWRRLEKDVAWAGQEIQKLGMNPEDVRWLL